MNIAVVSSVGTGNTELSAFDSALKHAGVYNYNIIPLSSVIPIASKVLKKHLYTTNIEECGWRLYVVMSNIRTSDPELAVAAGLGWYQFRNGAGVFVEHSAKGKALKATKDALKEKILTSLSDLCAFRGETYRQTKASYSIAIAPPKQQPRCALTIAVYKAENW